MIRYRASDRWIGKNEVRFLAIGGQKKVYGEIG